MEAKSGDGRIAIEVKTANCFLCPICMEFVPLINKALWSSCRHMYNFWNCDIINRCCRNCLYTYAVTSVNSGIVHIKCFIPECNEYLSPHLMKLILPESIYEKYERYRFIQTNQNARECPYCHTYQIGNPKKPNTKCKKCGNHFCYFHSNAHPHTQTCEEYENSTKRNNLPAIPHPELLKACPNCKILTEKISGCNHMKCSYCHIGWCWICGRRIVDSELSIHYRWWNFLGCPNRMMDINNQPLHGCKLIFNRILYFLLFITLGIPAILIFLVGCILCFPFAMCFVSCSDESSNRRFRLSNYLIGCEECCNITLIFCVTLPFWICYGIYRLYKHLRSAPENRELY